MSHFGEEIHDKLKSLEAVLKDPRMADDWNEEEERRDGVPYWIRNSFCLHQNPKHPQQHCCRKPKHTGLHMTWVQDNVDSPDGIVWQKW